MKVLYGDQSREPVQISSPEKTPYQKISKLRKIKKGKKISTRPKDKDGAVTREGSGFSATQRCKLALRIFEAG